MRYIPSWFPGADFKRFGEECHSRSSWLVNHTFDRVKSAWLAGEAPPSMVADMLQNMREEEDPEDQERVIKEAAAVAYLVGYETTLSSIKFFFLGMLSNPSVIRKAREELATVVGSDRLPVIDDLPHLPYIGAIVKETWRWYPAIPVVPHFSTEVGEYNGYYIPKGSLVSGNSWAILRDPDIYPEPEAFNPDRFLTPEGKHNPDVLDPNVISFGYGRRICPGRSYANQFLGIMIASILHCFDVSPASDGEGRPIPLATDIVAAFVTSPGPFACSIKPHSADAESLIQSYAQGQ